MAEKKKTDLLSFYLLGGAKQMRVVTGEDLRKVADLDVAHWAMTATQRNALVGDAEFLQAIDLDGNGSIRCDEVQSAVRWMTSILKDLSGATEQSDFLRLDALDETQSEAESIRHSILAALQNLGAEDRSGINLAQISDHEKILSAALQNGDGVIPPDPVADPLCAECIRAVMALVGKHKDLGGLDGVDGTDLDTFEKLAEGYLTWLEGKIQPFGDDSAAYANALNAIRSKTDEFFRSRAALEFDGSGDGKAGNLKYDPNDPESVRRYLESAPIANPEKTDRIYENCVALNPLYIRQLETFLQLRGKVTGCDGKEIVIDRVLWQEITEEIAPYEQWIKGKNTGIFDSFDAERLRVFKAEKIYDRIREMIVADKAVSADLSNCRTVKKLILFQKYMIVFLNNFVSLAELFKTDASSMIQVGKLVMDGRNFTLCTLVPNPAEHKRIVMDSDICVMYLDITRGDRRMKLAVAVTSGRVYNIFIGKTGVFFTHDGEVWDAKIFDFVKQPVSIMEAILEPYHRFADFLQKQADKFFLTRSKAYENSVEKSIQTTANAKADSIRPVVPLQPAPAPAANTPPNAGPLALIGGGISFAVIGSAAAFMVKTLQDISLTTVISVILGILLIFGGPVIVISLVKLFRRNLSRFFEANGNAMNIRMRLSLKMGRVFTYTPMLHRHVRMMAEQLGNFGIRSVEQMRSLVWKRWLIFLLLLGLIGVGLYFAWRFGVFSRPDL